MSDPTPNSTSGIGRTITTATDRRSIPTRGAHGSGSDVPSAAESKEPLHTGVTRLVPRANRRTKTIVITGASAGVGRAVARAFGELGDNVALLARGKAGLEGARRDVEQLGGRALVIPTDISDEEAVFEAADRIEKELGPVDVWINNAMASTFSPVMQMKPEEYRRVTEVTYLGYVWGTLAALRHMRQRRRGLIVQIGSALAFRGIPLQSAYCAAKHAIEGFCDSLRSELIHDGLPDIRVMAIHLPAVNTPQFDWVLSRLPKRGQPVPPIFQPEMVARAVAWAVENPRREIHLGWPTVKAILAGKLAGGIADWYLGNNGVEGQQTGELADPGAPSNLWKPLDDEVDYGARGRFDSRSQEDSLQWWLSRNRRPLAFTAAGLLTVAGLYAAFGRR